MRVTDDFVFFYTGNDIYSNHYRSTMVIPKYPKLQFYTVEHYMMFAKAVLFKDIPTAKLILAATHPVEAKKLGRGISGFVESEWVANRESIVTTGVFYKMEACQDIKIEAIRHRVAGRRFVEASKRDAIWGVGLDEDDPVINIESNWRGLNLLGKCWDKAIDLTLLGEIP